MRGRERGEDEMMRAFALNGKMRRRRSSRAFSLLFVLLHFSVFLCAVFVVLCEESFSKRTLLAKEDFAARARAPTQASFLLFYVLLVIKNAQVLLYVYLRRYISLFLFLSLFRARSRGSKSK